MSTYTVTVENGHLIVAEDGVDCCRFAYSAAALELAERLREAAEGLEAQEQAAWCDLHAERLLGAMEWCEETTRDAAEALLARAREPASVMASGKCPRCGAEMRGAGKTSVEAAAELREVVEAHRCDGWRAHP